MVAKMDTLVTGLPFLVATLPPDYSQPIADRDPFNSCAAQSQHSFHLLSPVGLDLSVNTTNNLRAGREPISGVIVKSFTLCLFVLFGFNAGASVGASNLKISSEIIAKLKTKGSVDVLVLYKPRANLSAVAQRKGTYLERKKWVYDELRKTALETRKNLGAWQMRKFRTRKMFYIVNADVFKIEDEQSLLEISMDPLVERISLDFEYGLDLPKVDVSIEDSKSQEYPPNITAIKAEKVWNELKVKGAGIVVGVQDTGIMWDHPALKSKYRGFSANGVTHAFNWHSAFSEKTWAPYDDRGHGTHVTGSVLGDDGGKNNIGVAPDAKWIGCRNMAAGKGKASTYIECFEFFLAPYAPGSDKFKDGRPDLAAHIVNNSWSCPPEEACAGPELIEPIKAMHAAGILVIAAAGNYGDSCASSFYPPGFYSGLPLIIGAYNQRQGGIPYYSSRGPSTFNGGLVPDVVAPGHLVRSSVPSGGASADGFYDTKAGTSMASPHVAGAVALLWSAKPELIGKIDETKDLVKKSATPIVGSQGCAGFPANKIPNTDAGFGLIDTYRLIAGK